MTFIDLFCGCGGFSLGLRRAGFKELAAIDFNEEAIATVKTNFKDGSLALHKDLTTFHPTDLDQMFESESADGTRPKVDVIVGGPPCQGFSPVRRVDGSNHGDRMVEDKRRYLYQEFLAYVSYFQPRVFVMENVLGIKSTAQGEFFTRVQAEARALGYRVHGQEVRAWQYGVPQKRVRQLIIGTRRELPIFAASRFMRPTHALPNESGSEKLEKATTVWEAIGDLPPLESGTGQHEMEYDSRRRQSQLANYGGRYLKRVLQIQKVKILTGHVARPHNQRDLRDFALLQEGESSATAMRDRNVVFEWPYSKAHFKDRYTRQHRHRLCSTIVAHLSKDGLMFIHPTQRRSLTPREAARIQSFPDWFVFPSARTHSFRQIGNAVPPVLGEAVGRAIKKFLATAGRGERSRLSPIPQNMQEAVEWLLPLVDAAENNTLRKVSLSEFKRGWFSLGFVHSHLHPDSASENGSALIEDEARLPEFYRLIPQLVTPAFAQSGWPVKLVPIAEEAFRRFEERTLKANEYYCSDAQMAGARWQVREERIPI